MAGFIKKGILFLILTPMILPLFSGAQTLKNQAKLEGYHAPYLFTEVIDNAYSGHNYIMIRPNLLYIGTNESGESLVVEKYSNSGDYRIYPYAAGKHLVLGTVFNDAGAVGHVYIRGGGTDGGDVLLAYHENGYRAANVGVGIGNPTALLHVGGTTKIDGTLNVAGKINITGGNYITSTGNFVIRLS